MDQDCSNEFEQSNRKSKKAFQWNLKKLNKDKKNELNKNKSKKIEIEKKYEKLENDLREQYNEVFAEKVDNKDVTSAQASPPTNSIKQEPIDKMSMYIHTDINSKKKLRQQKMKEKLQQQHNEWLKSTPISNHTQDKQFELHLIEKSLKTENLRLYPITGDGHCLFRAIAHQLQLAHTTKDMVTIYTHKQLREMSADFIESHMDDFFPFLIEQVQDKAGFIEYCNTMRDTAEWGGELELKALSILLEATIFVHGGSYPSELYKFDESNNLNKLKLHIVYQRYAYKTGEHYNSTIPIDTLNEEFDESDD